MTTSLLNVLITGANGQLARAITHHPRAREVNLIPCMQSDLDITSPLSISNALDKYKPNILINTAAYTAVDKAEHEIKKAELINHVGVANVANACAQHQIPMIHLSTDYVFDGQKTAPYTETDVVNPINVYGKSKWLGEEAVRELCPQHIILRVSGIFSEHGSNFFNTLLKIGRNNPDLRIVSDQFTCPTYAGDIADTLFTLSKKLNHFGTYHFCSAEATSWHDFAVAILERHVQAITAAEYGAAAKRPAYSVLDCHKIATDYVIEQPSWQRALWSLQ